LKQSKRVKKLLLSLKLVVLPLLAAGFLGFSPFSIQTVPSAPDKPPVRILNQNACGLKDLKNPFTFVVIGDNRSGNDIYAKLVSMIAKDDPAFVMNTGDVIMEGGDRSEWDEFATLSKPLTMPYFLTPGNHEIANKVTEKEYKHCATNPGNDLYYSFTAGNALIVVLDSEETGMHAKIAGEQYKWLEDQLKNSDKKFKFVFLHRPLYPAKKLHVVACMSRYKDKRDRLQALFQEYGVDIVFAGHEHLYHRQEICGVTHVITGGGGAPLYATDAHGGFHHYVIGTVGEDEAEFKVIDVNGNIRDQFTISKKEKGNPI
jgi:predicted phosphodiesterase